jgi:hypothetical protein
MMNQEDALNLLCGERQYQESLNPKMNHKGVPTIEAEIIMMEHYLLDARTKWTTTYGNAGPALDAMRKVAGIAVRCFENHGCPPRTTPKL